ncbi:prefoldin subunit 5 [Strongylocentrotus purpuratus]|uniref:Prefoldin subunit 5 n=1 Tax=Strongylocentrotus purpuratus TaxID=7668 RepID=A0A7M7G3L6_STRPU|nr:prefoldin subunit 5 [Strongylocentrotus purpuratus]|eukprot:XP_001178621.1 PREDICTED: prefoldin subunit 5-like [Strongylocentrotus purpuratus]
MAEGQQVDLMQLPLPQLNGLKEQLDQEVEMMQNSLQQLKMAQSRFVESSDSISKLNKDNEGKEMLVPLTSSLYVPGKLQDVNNVLIDIGTGYFVEKPLEEAKKYFKRKVDFVTKQMEKVQPVLIEKSKMRQVVMDVMNMKIQAQMSQMQNQPVKS